MTTPNKILNPQNHQLIAQLISLAENYPDQYEKIREHLSIDNEQSTTNNQQPTTSNHRNSEPFKPSQTPVLGITGTGGAGKSSLVDELVRRFLLYTEEKTVAIISVDPSKRKTGGALLGDRIRMNSINNQRVYMRSLATRQSNLALSKYVKDAIDICKAAGFDLIIVETSGIGQSDTEITEHADVSLYVMTSEYGAATQLEKIDMLDFADLIAINKFDKRGSLDALRDVRKQYRRNRNYWEGKDEDLPVYGTIASQFNDLGMNILFGKVMEKLGINYKLLMNNDQAQSDNLITANNQQLTTANNLNQLQTNVIIPPNRVRYLAEIAENSDSYDRFVEEQVHLARKAYNLYGTIETCKVSKTLQVLVLPEKIENLENESEIVKFLAQEYEKTVSQIDYACRQKLQNWAKTKALFTAEKYQFKVRDKIIEQDLYTETLSHLKIPKVALPKYQDWGDILKWILTENVAGEFPYSAGVFPLKREGEDPARMFAGEGNAERTNKRFHFLSMGMPAKRLSTAFDSVTLYGENPDRRPDIYGKVGNSGVSIFTLNEAKKLYSGFNLCNPNTSVSMTINGPAPMILAFFMNTAIDQQCEIYIRKNGLLEEVERKIKEIYANLHLTGFKNLSGVKPQYNAPLPEGNDGLGLLLLGVTGDQVLDREVYEKIKAETLQVVRGTVQADILKEDQAQNTCIFSTEFALRMMGDIQEYFVNHKVRNFYSVSISGYHIAEAGANPISQLAFTLANGFTFVEYYLSRGMHIDDFAPNLSFFFSNGMDPEYSVMGRVARRIWAKAMKYKYKGNDRSQKLKYHIQTSGRSLHAQEIAFNDIRTTLQALYAIYDNCNSLHTNAYDEAITTPTEESVRRALAIQLIINHELGLAKNENPLQGSFIIEELTDLVEQAVLQEFRNISERGGVLGAMERMYQRSKIQEESLYYETLKHEGKLPIIGVNTFLDPNGSPTIIPQEVIRSTIEEKELTIKDLENFHAFHAEEAKIALKNLQSTAVNNGNIFESLMEAAKVCSLGQMSQALYEVGGQYRRNM
ncbi:methylmalonyl-CoA mutase [Thermoflexibacter ruber]|uniref:Methylmalonyl-CoA mutase n=1 Tax=Thermoflexibacter ruber TaxID=1003 RepID=A0A1I2HXP3_9BACT|nr:methylmalonyl-CoA mutase family protein [Thermoflexibacter ruber]SFF34298.1 methylmalonyl-CoA mutase [Thermoflexibacter ruber]